MRNDKIINAIKKLEGDVVDKHRALTIDLMPKVCKDASDFQLSKVTPTYGPKVLIQLLGILNQDSKGGALLLVEAGDFKETLSFKDRADALYAKRKLKKIARLAFDCEVKLTVDAA